MSNKVLIALHPGLRAQVDEIAKREHRTRSELIREALRRYIEGYIQKCVAARPDTFTQTRSVVK